MNNISLIWEYVRACVSGNSGFSDCGPVWQLGAISGLVTLAVLALLVLVAARLRGNSGRRSPDGPAAAGAFAPSARAR
jgi:hypothetical protein